jgi:hypothetical protein
MTVLSVPGNVYRRNTVERTRIAIIFFIRMIRIMRLKNWVPVISISRIIDINNIRWLFTQGYYSMGLSIETPKFIIKRHPLNYT